ncbi:hypothetical protein QBC35DRAFT_27270 [Podospora australis]|uniref:Serum paraoxonase/arylesterase n=1 Tax=Podospora australis TaxID=1536484 RepID=A0AAN7ALN8_9PEZI|nr:hypothetical protein QBC35DRAFT_27270 [Podospora australis]
MKSLLFSVVAALLAYAYYSIGHDIQRAVTVLGLFRRYPPGGLVKTEQVTAIPDTAHCEDLHHHIPSGYLFTACEDNTETRFKWFPPLTNFEGPELARKSQGSIHVIDAKGLEGRRLKFENFDGPFITHGIDVIDDDKHPKGKAVYIFAVNHLPDPTVEEGQTARARSQIEVFHHFIGSDSVRHVRSVWHPLIRTPNDVFASSPTSFFVTNDHWYSGHHVLRQLEDVYHGAKWTDTVHIHLETLNAVDSTTGVTASIAIGGMHNNNGLGHGRSKNEILVSQAASGVMHVAEFSEEGTTGHIKILETIEVDSVVDNPSYFSDPFANSPADDRSGFLLPGISWAVDLARTSRDPAGKDPVLVYFAKQNKDQEVTSPLRWERRVIFEDDSSRIRTASAAVLVAIDPAEANPKGARQAWLFVTGFMSENMIALKVDL